MLGGVRPTGPRGAGIDSARSAQLESGGGDDANWTMFGRRNNISGRVKPLPFRIFENRRMRCRRIPPAASARGLIIGLALLPLLPLCLSAQVGAAEGRDEVFVG